MVGIIQEQHPDRCRLFMQWKQMDWPLMVDSLNLLEVTAVPITLFVDESGVIRHVQPQAADVMAFLSSPAPPARPEAQQSRRPNLDQLKPAAQNGTAREWIDYANATVHWAESSALDRAVDGYRRALDLLPGSGSTHFRLGVAYRKRYDSPHRQSDDFRLAIAHWTQALEIDPNQYIWRRRIQQYGPRLDKPYPFYDWVQTARAEVVARGEKPILLVVEPSGAEIAAPAKDLTQNNGGKPEPDPEGRIHRDNRPLIQIESVVVPSTGGTEGSAARVHLLLRPNRSVQAHWNNESDPLVVWIDPPAGWKLTASHHSVPNAPQAISEEIRRIEFDVKSEGARQLGAATFRGYALYYVCEGVNGTCLYRRQDLNITLNRPVPKDSAVHP